MTTRVVPKPEDILWPVTERTIEAINFNFDLLFRDVEGITADIIPVDRGGTNLTSYTRGDLLVASSATVLSRLPDVATGHVLLSGGVGAPPAYGKVGLTTHVSGVLPIANGGTGQTSAIAAFDALAPTSAKGDLIGHDGLTSVAVALGAAHAGMVLTVDPAAAAGFSWQRLPISSLRDLFLRSAASSDLAGYRRATDTQGSGAQVDIDTVVDADTKLLEEWATEPGDPGQEFLPEGSWHLHVHAQKTAGTRDFHLYWEAYSRTTGGVETLLGTSEHSETIGTSPQDVDLDLAVGDVDLDVTDRLVVKLYAHRHGAGTNPTARVSIEGTTGARFEHAISGGGASATLPLTTKGDLLTRDATETVRLGVGTDGYVLTADAAEPTGLKWAPAAGGSPSPLTTKGDLYVFGTDDDRLPVGSNGDVLMADSTVALGVKWAALSFVGTHGLLDTGAHTDVVAYLPTKGRIIVANDTPKWAVLEPGADGALLMRDVTTTTGLKWANISGEPHALLSETHTDVEIGALATRGAIIYGKAVTSGAGLDGFWVDGQKQATVGVTTATQKVWADGAAGVDIPGSTAGSVTTIKWAVLDLGDAGEVLRSDGVDLYWGSLVSGGGGSLPITTKGDLVTSDGVTVTRLGVGADGYLLVADAAAPNGIKWAAPSAASSPLTTKGDLLVYSTEETRQPVGTNGYVLTADSTQTTGLVWAAPATAQLTAKGDLLTRTGATFTRLAVGSNGDVLVAASGASEGLAWAGFIRARVSRTSNITLPDATETTIDFTVEEYDSHNMHDLVTNPSRLTVPPGGAGTYLIVGQGSFAAPTGGRRAVWIFVNGSRVGISEGYTDTPTGSPLGFTIQATAILSLAVGDYIQLRLRQDSGADDTILATGPDLTALQCIRLTTG